MVANLILIVDKELVCVLDASSVQRNTDSLTATCDTYF
jgi:hypothetical protein